MQKILVKRLNLKEAGLGGKERTVTVLEGPLSSEASAIHLSIKRNYRNSRQILRAASQLANIYGELANKSGEEIEVLDPELAVRETAKPIALKTDSQIKKAGEIAARSLAQGQTQAWTICIATASAKQHPPSEIIKLRPAGVAAAILNGDYIKRPDTVVVSSLNDLKGFESNLVIVIGCDEGAFPAADVAPGEIWRDALRLYVCMTRARDQVYMLHDGTPSPFLIQMGDRIVQAEEPLQNDYQPAPPGQPSPQRMQISDPPKPQGVTLHESCFDQMSGASRSILWCYYEANISKLKWKDCRGLTDIAMNELRKEDNEAFRNWVTPYNLARLQARDFFRMRNVGKSKLAQLAEDLRTLGIRTFLNPRRQQPL